MEGQWDKRSELEKTLLTGVYGPAELRPDEKRQFLGFFRERVIEAVTFEQLRSNGGLRAIGQALKSRHAHELVIHNRVRMQAMPLIMQAQREKIDFTIVTDSKFSGDIAVAVVAKTAVEVDKLFAEGR